MYFRKLLFLTVFLSVANSYAQDTVVVNRQQIAEQTSPIVALRDEFYSSPALRVFYRTYNFSTLAAQYTNESKDVYLQQIGAGSKGGGAYSESFNKNITGITLWGKAYYNNEKVKSVNFNESADYDMIFPYVMADTVGGDLNSENYFFGGGISKMLGKFRYGVQGSFKGLQSFRNRDPRPKNISTTIDFSLSIAKEFNAKQAFSVDLLLQKYNQNNALDFVNELGFPLVYHDAGLGVYNELLAGTKTQAYYKGKKLGTRLSFAPIDLKGFSATLEFNNLNVSKVLSSVSDNVSTLTDNYLNLNLAYFGELGSQRYIFKLKSYFNDRKGTEATFANLGGPSLQKIVDGQRYNRSAMGLLLDAAYGKALTKLSWFLGITGNYAVQRESYDLPDRFMDVDLAKFGVYATVNKTLGKTQLSLNVNVSNQIAINSSYDWVDTKPNTAIYQMLTANYQYLSTNWIGVGAMARADFPFTNKVNGFTKINTSYLDYGEGNSNKAVSFGFGVLF